MDKAALYIRLSKEDVDKEKKGDDSESIVNQRLLLMNYAIDSGLQNGQNQCCYCKNTVAFY